ncbi:hypothetical protein [Nocardia sp. BMG111209]|nr:hypothetical protein [Nocardia sp. BMG111209]
MLPSEQQRRAITARTEPELRECEAQARPPEPQSFDALAQRAPTATLSG